MANPVVATNQKQTNPSMKDLLDLLRKDIFLNLNCHAVGTIQSFDSSKQTATVTINYKKSQLTKTDGENYTTVLKDYPLLIDVPVFSLRGGSWQLTFPITAGDECLVIFNDRDIDNWFQSGQVGGVASGRLHSMSDGFALVGVRSVPNAIADFDMSRAVLSNGQTMVGVGETLIKIANASTSLGAILTQLMTDLTNVATALSGNPSTEPAAAAAGAALATAASSIQTLITELLE